ncbi:MAG: hypothetical protein J1E57_07210 [Prevotella sp.]|nr:hypothetical protein [Prevotella sp.]
MEAIDAVLVLMYLMMLAAVAVMVFSIVRSIRLGNKSLSVVNGVPAGRIVGGTVAFTVVLLVITFLAGSSAPLTVNGETYGETLWLKVADMFIFTSSLMFLVAAALIVYGLFRRRDYAKKK